jgi:hypothetical protein
MGLNSLLFSQEHVEAMLGEIGMNLKVVAHPKPARLPPRKLAQFGDGIHLIIASVVVVNVQQTLFPYKKHGNITSHLLWPRQAFLDVASQGLPRPLWQVQLTTMTAQRPEIVSNRIRMGRPSTTLAQLSRAAEKLPMTRETWTWMVVMRHGWEVKCRG